MSVSWLPGLARARTMPERHVRCSEMIFPFGEFQPLTPTIITALPAKGISDCTLYIKSAVFGFQNKRKGEKKKKEMKLGSLLLSCAFFR